MGRKKRKKGPFIPRKLKWIYEVYYRKRGDVEAEHKRTEIMNCQSRDEVNMTFAADTRFRGMTITHCKRLRKMVPEDLEKLEAPAAD